MKKIIATLVILSTLGQFQAESSNMNRRENEKEEVNLVEMKKGRFDETRTRSLGPDVSAYVDCETGQIEISFNTYIGNATIYLLNGAGMALQTYGCNTEMEWLVYLPIPSSEGSYTLKIDSAGAEYTGEFTL